MPLELYNTLTRKKEFFVPLNEGRVAMYVCGPTVYGHAHIGHAKSYISFDVIVRWLRHLGYAVKYVQNITDVGHLTDDADAGDDKIAEQAKREKTDPMEVAQFYTRSFYEDMDRLGNLRPNIAPLATGHIPEQIELIERLIASGHAYEANGSVYFSVQSFTGYGKLSGRLNQEELEPGTRIEIKSEKHAASDFALWKKAESNHLMRWNSPWGVGFPGWHIECSAMAMKYLGESFDIHGGGLDNQFPHHECEIAQSEAATGRPFVKYWLHNNLVTVGGQKMGKSLGNFLTVKDALKKFSPVMLRFFILQSHYRSPLDFSDAALEAAGAGLEKLHDTYRRLGEAKITGAAIIELAPFEQRFIDSMNDDFNSPTAIATFFDLNREVNTKLSSGGFSEAGLKDVLSFYNRFAGDVLGILPGGETTGGSGSADAGNKAIDLLLELRQQAKAKKDFATSDLIRMKLTDIGVEVQDTKEGSSWKLKN
ncbi:MAG: cysteine--tRNA ligase [Rhizobacter sp.]|nr:cysteine--tRNA ligase [Chlorobiales bacterium]